MLHTRHELHYSIVPAMFPSVGYACMYDGVLACGHGFQLLEASWGLGGGAA